MIDVIFHGSFNSYDQIKEYWLPELQESKNTIIFPKFPVDTWQEITDGGPNYLPKKQSKDIWLKEFNAFYPQINDEKELTFIGHSTGPLFILHVLHAYKIKLKSALFVCPFINPLTKAAWQVQLINSLYYTDQFDFEALKFFCPQSTVVYSVDDPYVETENSLAFAKKMGSKVISIEKGGYLNYAGSFKYIKKFL